MKIYIIGFMGTGKSTVGKALAFRIGWKCLDTDHEIVKREGRTIPEIFAESGELYFRETEANLLAELAVRNNLVITTGGGVVLRRQNRELMRNSGYVISLTATKEVIKERVSRQAGRPLLAGEDLDQRIERLMAEREGMYDDADLRVDTSNRDVADIVEEILRHPTFPVR